MVGEGGIVAAAVVRVEHKGHVQHPGLQSRVAQVLPEHQQEILCRGQLRPGHVDEQALPLSVPPSLVGVDGQHRHVAQELEGLAQHVLQADVVGLVVIAGQGQDGPLHGVHQVLGRGLHDDVPEEIGGKGPVGRQLAAEGVQLLPVGQLPKQEQIGRLLEGVPPPLLGAPHDLPAVDAPVVQHALGGPDVLVLRHRVGLDLRHPGQAGQHAPSVLVPEAALDLVVRIQLGIDVVLLFPLLLQGHDGRSDLTIGVLPVFLPDHTASSFHLLVICSFASITYRACIFNGIFSKKSDMFS